MQIFTSRDIHWWTGVVWITCGLLWFFISCLDSHSDGTHSLQRIHWQASDTFLQICSDKETALLLYVHTRYNLFAHSSCTSLFILLFIKSTVLCIAHFILFHILLLIFILFVSIFIYIPLRYVNLFCTVQWADLSWFTFHYWLYPV